MLPLLLACAPAATISPPVPLAEGQVLQAGVGLVGGGPVTEGQDAGCELALGCAGASATLYAWAPVLGGRVELGAMAFAGNTSLFGGGFFARGWYLDRPDLRVGAELEAGWLWAAGGPVVAKKVGPTWIYTHPTAGARYVGVLRLPVGVGLPFRERGVVGAELGLGWDPWWIFQDPADLFLFGSVTVGYRF